MDPLLAPHLAWARSAIEPRLSGVLVNWYDAERARHIGKHRDSPIGLVPGAPIVTISLGASRLFRPPAVPGHEGERVDVPVDHGTVLVVPWAVNRTASRTRSPSGQARTPAEKSVTIRAFDDQAPKGTRRAK